MRYLRYGIIVAIALSVSGCFGGGGGGDEGNPPQTPVQTGTTVQGPSGASVSIPAGASPANTQIVITQSNVGAPSLPTGSIPLGQMFAFTPHGTTFAAPVTVTIPFDPALVPSGMTPVLYKTNRDNTGWELVAGSTVSGAMISGAVTSFSHFAAVVEPLPTVEKPVRFWEFTRRFADLDVEQIKGNLGTGTPAPDGVLREEQHFGLLSFQPVPNHIFAMGEIYSNETGRTYWVEAEAPVPDMPLTLDWEATVVGGESKLLQKQSYRKDAPNATLDLWITDARFIAADFNGTVPRRYVCPWEPANATHARCLDILRGLIEMTVRVYSGREGDNLGVRTPYELHNSTLRLEGYTNNFEFHVTSDADDPDNWSLGAYRGLANRCSVSRISRARTAT